MISMVAATRLDGFVQTIKSTSAPATVTGTADPANAMTQQSLDDLT
jgi:hypothetical protein